MRAIPLCHFLCVSLLCACLCPASSAWPQQATTQLSPSEAFASAMAPFNAARAQADDLTDADTLALGLGVAQASHSCLGLTPNAPSFAKDPAELLALGRICIFGQQYELARTTLVQYLALQDPPEREMALLLLTRALLGMNDPGSAQPQVLSLFRDYPYDAQIHYAADQVIEATEAISLHMNQLALQLCGKQNTATLPLLHSGKSLVGKDASASASTLYVDALHCATLARSTGDISASDTMAQLKAIVQQPQWKGTADLLPMQEALARAEMTGQAAPLATIQAHSLNAAGTLQPRSVSLMHNAVMFMPFTLWSPSTASVIRTLALSAPQQTIYALTSWTANTGSEDVSSPGIAAALRTWQQGLPPHVSLLIVPDADLRLFHTNPYPAGIVIRDGKIIFNDVLTGQGAIRMLLTTLPPETRNTPVVKHALHNTHL